LALEVDDQPFLCSLPTVRKVKKIKLTIYISILHHHLLSETKVIALE
jgi:hypothetical protein